MSNAVDGVLRVVPETGVSLSQDEAGAILEISFLAIAADRKLRDEELEAFRHVAGRLRTLAGTGSDDVTDRDFEKILESFSADIDQVTDRDALDERLRRVCGRIKRPEIRQLAYKVAYALALCDLDTSDEEFEFDLQLLEALELTTEQSERLEGEVLEVFQG